jgi:hypothetical protein
VNCGTLATDTVEILEAVGASRIAAKIEGINKLFPGGQPSNDEDERGEQLDAIAQRSEEFQELCLDLEHWLMGETLPNGEYKFGDEDPVQLAFEYLSRSSKQP